MKEDYLWDKSGEPDPDIQQLEEILGTLRYQPKPLEFPQDLPMPRPRRNHFPLLAIAASVMLALLAAGIWLRVRTQSEPQPVQANVAPADNDKTPVVAKQNDEEPKEQRIEQVRKGGLPPLTRHSKHRSSSTVLAKREREREEALAAKEQVMLALRLTSEKLSLVHKKTHNSPNLIKNQHRVG
jgi:hypothetical protein